MICVECHHKLREIARLREENERLVRKVEKAAGQASLFGVEESTLDPERGLAESKERTAEILDRFASKEEVAAKREIALRLAREIAERSIDGTVMVWQIQKLFHERLGLTKCTWTNHVDGCEWLTSIGTSYWAGSIFSTKEAKAEWECVGSGCSPANNNDSNKIWQRRRFARVVGGEV